MQCFAILFFLLALVPLKAQQPATSTEIHIDEPRTRFRVSTGVTDFNIESRGKIEVTDDDKDVKSLSPDGYLEISKTVFGSKRKIIIEAAGGGQISRTYYEGRNQLPWDPNGKKWLAEILPEVVRKTTIGAQGRVNRIFSKGGVMAVVTEIGQMESDYVKAHYANLLLEKNFPSGELPAVIRLICNDIHSDYYLATVLKKNVDKLIASEAAATAFYEGSQHIESDYYKTVVLKAALTHQAATSRQVRVILKSAETIHSDYYLAVTLNALLEKANVSEESLNDVVLVSKKIESDYYKSQVLEKVLHRQDLSKLATQNMVEALGDVNSDYYKTSVFNNLTEKSDLAPEVQVKVIESLKNSVGSDYYTSISFKKMLEHQKLSEENFHLLVSSVDAIHSDYYASEVLRAAANRQLTKQELMALVAASASIESDYYQSGVLLHVADKVKASDAAVKDAYRQAAKQIGSETYYGRALKAIE